ncbi:MAG TPA: hypothetical protein DCR20_11195 [Planctomycetaceae bacterium]|nr:hypothetical protein [Planctomycetaceae bacterium]
MHGDEAVGDLQVDRSIRSVPAQCERSDLRGCGAGIAVQGAAAEDTDLVILKPVWQCGVWQRGIRAGGRQLVVDEMQ